MRQLTTDVVVVGAGPVGLLLAGELRLGGADVVVVERLASPHDESRASQLSARTMEILDQRGLLSRLGDPPREAVGHFGGLPLDVSGVASPHAGHWKVPQTDTEAVLGAWASHLGAVVRRNHELVGLDVHDDHVAATVEAPDGPSSLRCSYLVGCDGQDSTVRQLAGIAFVGTDATRELLRGDVVGIDVPNRRFERLPGGLAIAARRPDGVTRVMVHEVGRGPVGRDPTFAELAGAWQRVTGEDISSGTPVWLNAFDNTTRQAAEYRRGRVLLAGDAAHRQMPIGGQALNTGLGDAFNLGWKLAAVVGGSLGCDDLLDSYHAERRPVGAAVQDDVRAQELLLLGASDLDPLRVVLGDLLSPDGGGGRLAGVVSGVDVRYDVGPGDHPLRGARLPPCDLWTAAGRLRSADVLAPGRGLLLSIGDGPAVDGRAAPWGDRVWPLVAARVTGLDGLLSDGDVVLVRPDGHVAWVGADAAPDGLEAALNRWFGSPVVAPSLG